MRSEQAALQGRGGWSAEFLGALPLLIGAAFFGLLGLVVRDLDPTYGPGYFALWALLLAVGFICAMGGVAAWLLVGPPPASADPRAKSRRRDAPPPLGMRRSAPQPMGQEGPLIPSPDFGRPAPEVYRRLPDAGSRGGDTSPSAGRPGERAEWDEGPPARMPQYPRAPAPTPSTTRGEPTADVLHDLDRLEEELHRKPRERSPG